MRRLAIISLSCGVAAVAQAGEAACPDPLVTLENWQQACSKFVYLKDSREFSMMLRPDSIPRAVALAHVHRKARDHCKTVYGRRADPSYTASRGSWAVPGTWQFTGSCK